MRFRGAREAVAILDPEGRACLLFGDIGGTAGGFYDVLSFLGHVRWRGELVLEGDGTLRSLYFDEGHVVAAASTAKDEAIGEVLVRAGRLTREQADACVAKIRDGSLRFGEAAVSLGFLTNEELFAEMGRQIDAVFTGVVKTQAGSFGFFDGYDESRLAFRQKRVVDGLLLDAIRRIDEAEAFPEEVRSSDRVPKRTTTVAPPASDPLGLYEKIDGKATVGEIVEKSGTSELAATKALFELVQTGHVTIVPPRIGVTRIVEVYNEPLAFLLRELDAANEGARVRAQLEKFASEQENGHLVKGAGPNHDGTFDAAVVLSNVGAEADPDEAEGHLSTLLYDYASYALFLARPHLHRKEERDDEPRVSSRVAAMLEAIAPLGERMKSERVEKAVEDAAHAPAPPAVTETKDAEREKKLAAFPGLDPSRVARMPALSEERLAALKASRQLPAFVPPSLPPSHRGSQPRLPVADAAPKSKAAPTPAKPPTLAEDASPPPSKQTVVVITAVVLAIALVGALIRGSRTEAPVPPPPLPVRKTELRVVCSPSCTEVTVDGQKIEGRNATSVGAGTHQIAVIQSGVRRSASVTMAEGESRTLFLESTPMPDAEP